MQTRGLNYWSVYRCYYRCVTFSAWFHCPIRLDAECNAKSGFWHLTARGAQGSGRARAARARSSGDLTLVGCGGTVQDKDLMAQHELLVRRLASEAAVSDIREGCREILKVSSPHRPNRP